MHPYFLQSFVDFRFHAMSKILYLLRHAHAGRSHLSLSDFDRPLSDRGRKAASRMAAYMKQHGLTPTLVLCSSARRAAETWELMSSAFNPDIAVEQQRGLYLASSGQLLATLKPLPATVERLLVVAHNPGIADLALSLAGPGSTPHALEELQEHYPPAALAEFHLTADSWSKMANSAGRLERFVQPSEL